jgi:sporulation protein YlmC with PRC-barrel domain
MPESVVHLSTLAGSALLDSAGERLGRVEDVIVRLDTGDQLPPVTGLKVRIGGRELFVPADRIESLEPRSARTSTTKLDLGQFERRPGEVLVRADVLGRSMIDVNTARLVKARDVELVRDAGTWRVAGIDPALGAGIRRFLPRRFRRDEHEHAALVPWSQTEAFVVMPRSARSRAAPRVKAASAALVPA